MKAEHQVDLYPHNTMRLHSIADIIYYPESIKELKEIIGNNADFILLSAGSNMILPPIIHRPVISLMSLNNKLEMSDKGEICVGCSVRIQNLIRFLQEHNMGGVEYLYSIPASVGGLVYMNGGRGKKMNQSISDYLESVEYLNLDNMSIQEYRVNNADFSYRTSPFQKMNVIILTCCFKFKSRRAEETERLIAERLSYSKEFLSADKPSCGSVFKIGNPIVFRLLRGMRVGGAMFSKKTPNWISNVDNASYEDICKLIKRAQLIHKLFLSRCQLEVKVIEE